MAEEQNKGEKAVFYCPKCARVVEKPLVCGDCSAVICRECGTALEVEEELGLG